MFESDSDDNEYDGDDIDPNLTPNSQSKRDEKVFLNFSPLLNDIVSSLDDLPPENQTKILFWDFKDDQLRYDQDRLRKGYSGMERLKDTVSLTNKKKECNLKRDAFSLYEKFLPRMILPILDSLKYASSMTFSK